MTEAVFQDTRTDQLPSATVARSVSASGRPRSAASATGRTRVSPADRLRNRIMAARQARHQQAFWLLSQLRAVVQEVHAAPAEGTEPQLDPGLGDRLPATTIAWLRERLGHPVYAPEYEQRLRNRTGPDVFGLARPPLPPEFLAGLDLSELPPETVAPFLRGLSLVRAGGTAPTGSGVGAPGAVSSVARSAELRQWGQRDAEPVSARSAAPLLPERTVIPHLVHGIWLGGPVPTDASLGRNFAAGARRYAGAVDFVLWTDVSRTEVVQALAAVPMPGSRLAGVRAMVEWARGCGVHVVNVDEVFHRGCPMVLREQFVAELVKGLPRGYAAASDQLRLEVVSLFGGAYVDGDNRFDVDRAGRTLPGSLAELFDAVAASVTGFTLHLRSETVLNHDVVVAPAAHPGLLLWREIHRFGFAMPQRELFGEVERMAQRYAMRPPELRWKRWTASRRSAQARVSLLEGVRMEPEDPRLVRVAGTICTEGEADEPQAERGAGRVLSDREQLVRTAGLVTATVRRLITRSGNLQLSAVAPTIQSMPNPDAVWIALLRFVAVLVDLGVAPEVTSVTRFRWEDDGSSSYVGLPPEAEAMLDYAVADAFTGTENDKKWLGGPLSMPGQPVWMLDEMVVPVKLRARADGGSLPSPGHGWSVRSPVPSGVVPVALLGRLGTIWSGHRVMHPEELALQLADLDQLGHPIWLRIVDGAEHGSRWFADHLETLVGQRVLLVDEVLTDRPPSESTVDPEPAPELWSAGELVARAELTAQQLPHLQETGRVAHRCAGEDLTGASLLLRALNVNRVASVLAEAEMMDRLGATRRGTAAREATDRVLAAYQTLAGSTAGDPVELGRDATEVAAAAATAAGLIAVAELLQSSERRSAERRLSDDLRADQPGVREEFAIRQRIDRALAEAFPRAADGDSPSGHVSDEEMNAVLHAEAGEILDEVRAGEWTAFGRRLERLETARRQIRSAAGIRSVAVELNSLTGRSRTEIDAAAAELIDATVKRRVQTGAARLRAEWSSAADARSAAARVLQAQVAQKLSPERSSEATKTVEAPRTPTEPLLSWLRKLTDPDLYTAEFETELRRRMGPDLLGLRISPEAPSFLADVDLPGLAPELVAPLLRRLSLVRSGVTAAELTVERLRAEAGAVASFPRSPAARCWGQQPESGPDEAAPAPLLPELTVIPHLVHGIWLGGPVPLGGLFGWNFAAGARRYAGTVDFVLWTDVSRAEVAEALLAAVPVPGSRLAGVRAMVEWARGCGVHVVNVDEVFHRGCPMVLREQFVAELVKGLPRGYAAASDQLRLEVVSLFGGAYVDGDNRFDVDRAGNVLPGSLPELLDEVAASVHGFTLHVMDPGKGIANDVVIGPARHPALRLTLEATRYSYRRLHRELFWGMEQMTQRFSGHRKLLMRYSLVRRTGWAHHDMLVQLKINLTDPRMIRVKRAISDDSELSWAPRHRPAPLSLTPARTIDRVAQVVAALARQLISREGNLYLMEVAPLVAELPDPDAAWIAVLSVLAELSAQGSVPPISSITEFRWGDDGEPLAVNLPPEAAALLDRTWFDSGWFGSELAVPGEPVWLLDESVTPVRWRHPAPAATGVTPGAELRARSETVTAEDGTVVGLRLRAGSNRPPPATNVSRLPGRRNGAVRRDSADLPAGWAGVWLESRCGQAKVGDLAIRAEDLQLLLSEQGLADRPVLLLSSTVGFGGLGPFAQRLRTVLRQPVIVLDDAPR